ncbi:M23 family metallopeptidase [Subtercola boreus]|nr:M23 family metallopeptidase [Subtercola boreus]TQL46902.1 peptidase M23-like protein [Subtercola boreus]
MVAVSFLVVSVTIPASAVGVGVGPNWQVTQTGQAFLDTQTVQVTDAAAPAVPRDEYTSAAPPPPPPPRVIFSAASAFARTADTFTNNPASPVQWPFTSGVPISDGYGPRVAPCSGCSSNHQGLDMNPGQGTPIQAMADGVVIEASSTDSSSLGVYAIIEHQIDGETVTSTYGHMLPGSLQLTVGQQVGVGDQVGNVGNTGNSTGAHLHFQLARGSKTFDPYAYLQEKVAL